MKSKLLTLILRPRTIRPGSSSALMSYLPPATLQAPTTPPSPSQPRALYLLTSPLTHSCPGLHMPGSLSAQASSPALVPKVAPTPTAFSAPCSNFFVIKVLHYSCFCMFPTRMQPPWGHNFVSMLYLHSRLAQAPYKYLLDGQMSGWRVSEWTDGWTHGWKDRWIDEQAN